IREVLTLHFFDLGPIATRHAGKLFRPRCHAFGSATAPADGSAERPETHAWCDTPARYSQPHGCLSPPADRQYGHGARRPGVSYKASHPLEDPATASQALGKDRSRG